MDHKGERLRVYFGARPARFPASAGTNIFNADTHRMLCMASEFEDAVRICGAKGWVRADLDENR